MAVLRVLGPANQAGFEVISGVKNRVVEIEAIKKGELVILGREFAIDYNNYEKVISLARMLNKPVILDLDDLLFALPYDHPDRLDSDYTTAALPMLQSVLEADLLTVATRSLREYLLPYNSAIEVIPNYLDDSLWQIKPPTVRKNQADPLIIGYMGGHSHAPDFALIIPALKELMKKYPDQIRLQFWGIEPPSELASYSRVDWFPPPSKRYSDFVAYFQRQEMDIAIAPLCENLFNACKSGIKFLEYSAIGAPGVYSRVTPYTEMIEDGTDGLLASTTEEWVISLSRLIESPDLRSKLITHAQQKIRQSWLLSRNLEHRKKVYEALVENYFPQNKTYPFFFELEKSITRQLYEQQLLDYHELSQKNHQIEILNQQLSELEDEVITYATSNSWLLTRPLRVIGNIIRQFKHA